MRFLTNLVVYIEMWVSISLLVPVLCAFSDHVVRSMRWYIQGLVLKPFSLNGVDKSNEKTLLHPLGNRTRKFYGINVSIIQISSFR